MFDPNPPKTIFPKTIPKTIPITAIQNGVVGGRLRARIRLDTKTADVIGRPWGRVNTASAAIPQRSTIAVRTRDRSPKK